MAGLLKYFFDTFLLECEQGDEEVDLSSLVEHSKGCSPLDLAYDDKDKAVRYVYKNVTPCNILPKIYLFSEMGAAIILNFCSSYGKTKRYSKSGIDIMAIILRKRLDPDVISQQLLLMHLSRIPCHQKKFEFLTYTINNMKIKEPLLDEKQWINLAIKVTQHKEVILPATTLSHILY